MFMAIIAGVDGGGFKTETVILDTVSKEVIGRGVSGPSNYHNVGMDLATINIVDSIVKAMNEAGVDYIDSLCIALAGLDTRYDREYVANALESLNISREIVIEHDAHAALMAGSLGEPGISVIAGTGSIAYGWDGSKRYISGNHGWLLGDQGSGFWIGFRALRTVVRMLDGRMEKTKLADYILEYFNAKDKEELSYKIYQQGFSVERIAGLAPIVSRAASEGDEVAQEILYKAGEELAKAVIAVAKKLHLPIIKIFYTGSIFRIPYVEETFITTILSTINNAEVYRIKYRPVVGSLVIAAKKIGLHKINWDNIKNINVLRI